MSTKEIVCIVSEPDAVVLQDTEVYEFSTASANEKAEYLSVKKDFKSTSDPQNTERENSENISNSVKVKMRKFKDNSYNRNEMESSGEEGNSSDVQEDRSFLEICKLAADKRLMALNSEEESVDMESDEEEEEEDEEMEEERMVKIVRKVPMRRVKREAVYAESNEADMMQEETCFLCNQSLVGEVTVMTMRLHVPLPSSFLSPVSLLRYFGVSFALSNTDVGSLVTVDVCWNCHTVVLEGDKAFHNFVSVGACMKNAWPKITQKSLLLKNVEDLCNVESMESYEEEKDELDLKPSKSGGRKRDAKKKKKKVKVKSTDLRMRMCELCGTSCAGLSNWEDHCENDHKVTKHWIRYSYQFALKQCILKKIKEVLSNEKPEEKIKCPACKVDFEGKNLVNHINLYHKIAIDDSSLVLDQRNEYGMSGNMLHPGGSHMPSGHMGNVNTSIIRRHDGDGNEIVQSCSNVMGSGNVEYMDERVTQVGVVCSLCHIFIEGSLLEHIELSHMDIVVLLKRDQTEASRYKIDTMTALESCDNIRSYKPKRLWKKLKFSCTICGVNKFSDLIKLLEHKRSIHKDCEEAQLDYDSCLVECQFCGYRVIGTPALRLHTVEKHVQAGNQSAYEYNCKLCIFQSATKEEYKRHMEMKHGKNFNQHVQCEICGKMVSSKYIGVHHKKMHSHSRNYACNMCEMKFFDCQSLKVHFTEEHVDNEYECELCQVKFKKYHQLRQHRIYVHSTKVFKCLYCDATFKRKCDLSSHTKRKHMEREYHYCNFCSKQFNDRGKRNKHLIMVHGVNREDTWSENFARNKRQKGYFNQRTVHNNEMEKNPQALLSCSQKGMNVPPNRQPANTADGSLIVEQVPQFGGMGFMHPHFAMHH